MSATISRFSTAAERARSRVAAKPATQATASATDDLNACCELSARIVFKLSRLPWKQLCVVFGVADIATRAPSRFREIENIVLASLPERPAGA